MTLILTIANARGVYQSSDYQLTDASTGAFVSDQAGTKQLRASFETLQLELAFTGIASIGSGSSTQHTVDWLSGELKRLPSNSRIQDICEALARRSTAAMKPYGARGLLTLVITFAVVGEPFRVAVISNADWRKHPPRARSTFTVALHTINKPFHLISGYRGSVPALQRHRLKALARATDTLPSEMLDSLSDINAIAAKNSSGYVSEGCWVTSYVAEGRIRRSQALNVGQRQGEIPYLIGDFDLAEWVKKNYRAAPGKEMRLVQSFGVQQGSADGVPVPPPRGMPRQFTLSGSAVVGLLRSPSGEHCASLEITQLDCVLHARCNETVTVPLVRVAMKGASASGAAFPRPLLPWPTISPSLAVDGAAVPRGWEYTVGYWIEGNAHHVTIPQSSRSIRNLAFLSGEEELVIVVPTPTAEFSWALSEDAPTAILHGTVWWRTRLDGTRG